MQHTVHYYLVQADSWPFRCLNPVAVLVRDTYRGVGTSRLLPGKLLTRPGHPPGSQRAEGLTSATQPANLSNQACTPK